MGNQQTIDAQVIKKCFQKYIKALEEKYPINKFYCRKAMCKEVLHDTLYVVHLKINYTDLNNNPIQLSWDAKHKFVMDAIAFREKATVRLIHSLM